jgi:hypothetical protein
MLSGAGDVRRYSRGAFMRQRARLEIGGAAAETVARWQDRLERQALACGCHAGALLVFATLVALLVQGAVGVRVVPVTGPLGWVLALFGAALLGKIVGLGWANFRLRLLAGSIAAWEEASR